MKTAKLFWIFWIFSLCFAKNDAYFREILGKSPENSKFFHDFSKTPPDPKLRAKIRDNLNLKIMILGDSHFASDAFGAHFRRQMSANSVGFVFPLMPKYHHMTSVSLKYNEFFELQNARHPYKNPLDLGVQTYAMGGISARSKRPGAMIKISLKNMPEKQNFTMAFSAPNLLAAFVITDARGQKHYIASKNPKSWDLSKTYALQFPVSIKSLIRNAKIGGYFIRTGEKTGENFIYHVAQNGAKATEYTRWDNNFMKKELKILPHDIIIFAYGTNDLFSLKNAADFKNKYEKLLQILKNANENARFLLISPPAVYENNKILPRFFVIRDAIQDLAEDFGALFFDAHEFMENTGGRTFWEREKLAKKDVHLTKKGYEFLSYGLQNCLKNWEKHADPKK